MRLSSWWNSGFGIGMHGLNADRVINMRYRWIFRAGNIELIDAPRCLLARAHGAAPILTQVGNNEHVEAVHGGAVNVVRPLDVAGARVVVCTPEDAFRCFIMNSICS